jgi:hypothetical protein
MLPGPGLNAPAAVALNGKIYLIGGFGTDTNVPSDGVLVYDTMAKTWSRAAPLPAPRGGHAAVVLAGKIHVLGGGNSKSTIADHDLFDPATNAWTTLAPLPRAEGSPAVVAFGEKFCAAVAPVFLTLARSTSTIPPQTPGRPVRRSTRAAPPGRRLLRRNPRFGGESQTKRQSLGEVLRLTRDGAWERVSTMPTPRNFARAVILGDAVYVVGGSPTPEPSHASSGSAIVERFRESCGPRETRGRTE